ncbi:RNA-directed DNA polymerase from mobile element jockey [Trichonephila inaurata madagascariensis]|uniref:RNA-directed DNA polymerase from mobile element jockey n=1 Tax=Trichonephila inaurata madagascariensis TaxID=2747483 RepID=A0A8X6X8S6_9ARAC|nr:RNA-directed DNA polymerase from mobile element jockey [Trichonephila inaurata madagascariensis]
MIYSINAHYFPTSPRVEVCLFADDAVILNQANTPQEVRSTLQKYLVKLKKWLKLWRISINTFKSRAIIFKKGSFKNKLQPLKLFRNNIAWHDEVEYLGVILDKKFTFKSHLSKITCKFKHRLQALHKLLYNRSKLSLNNKRQIYLQYLLPIITYASPVWGIAADYLIDHLQILQHRALHLILNAPTYMKRIHLHKDLKIPALTSRIKKLATSFHDQVVSYSNNLINIQSFVDAKEQSAALRNLGDVLEEDRFKIPHQKKQKFAEQTKLLQAQIDAWGLPPKPIDAPFQVIVHKKCRKSSNTEEESSAKKQRTDVTATQNRSAQLTVEHMDLCSSRHLHSQRDSRCSRTPEEAPRTSDNHR